MNLSIEIIDKRDNTVKKVSEDYKIKYAEQIILIENSKMDSFWGIGKNQKGKNMLGKLLMKVREEIKNE